jgi:hypothetical protein
MVSTGEFAGEGGRIVGVVAVIYIICQHNMLESETTEKDVAEGGRRIVDNYLPDYPRLA